ncbi:MAG: hypothetical protein P1U80_02605 [Pseudomonadales bacterium]|nr:hypothetical protein [Pseudomonadales bacterium]
MNNTNKIRIASLIALLFSSWIYAETPSIEKPIMLAIEDLGQLDINFQKAKKVTHYPGEYLPAEVSSIPGKSHPLLAPMDIQQVDFLFAQGKHVTTGEAVLVIRGPAVHHLVNEFEGKKADYLLRKKRYKNNKTLLNKQAINESLWIDISREYYQAKLEYEHLRHFFTLVIHKDETAPSLTLAAPINGIISYSNKGTFQSGGTLAEFMSSSSLALNLALPIRYTDPLSYLQVENLSPEHCQVEINRVGNVAQNVFLEAWSKPLPSNCALKLGQAVRVKPFFSASAFRIPQQAVFEWQDKNHIWIKSNHSLQAIPVQLISSEKKHYLISATTELSEREVLTSSVSAAQGILLGLGAE